MKKGILVVLLVLLAFTVWTVLASGKATNKEKVQQPTQIQKAEPGPGTFPEVVLPKQHVARPTQEDFKKEVLDAKGWTPEKVEAIKNAPSVRAEDETISEKELTYCRMSGNLVALYYYPTTGSPYLYCWGQVGLATLINMDVNPLFGVCPYPLYPFQPAVVRLRFFADIACTLYNEARIYGVDYSGGAYPSGELCTSDQANPTKYIFAPGTNNMNVNLLNPTSCCVYDKFFAVFVIDNTDDFVDTTYCAPIYFGHLSFLFDNTGLTNNSFWNPYGLGGSWYDVVTYGIASGPLYIQVFGYTAPENTCSPPANPWFFKDPYPPLAPFGVPDFNQYQPLPTLPAGPAYCGPTAEANSYWYFAAQGLLPANPPTVPELIEEIARAAGTDPVLGTNCDALEAAIIAVIKAHGGWNFVENTVYAPDFWYLQAALKACEDKVLLLGFWQEDPPGVWNRFGGHFVTLSGVDIFNLAFAFSDPAMDKAEGFPPPPGPGLVLGDHSGLNDHNTGITSYDFYFVAWPSASPGGLLWLPDYIVNWPDFQGQNAGPMPNTGTYNSALPVHVEVEQAIDVYPGPLKMSETVKSSKATETENNQGGIEKFYVDLGLGLQSGLYYGTFIKGNAQENLTLDYGDYATLHPFIPLAAPKLDTFKVAGTAGDYTIQQLTLKFAHRILALEITKYAFGVTIPDGGTEDCEYAIEDVFVIKNTGTTDIEGLKDGMWLDFDVSSGGTGDLADFSQKYRSIWMYDASVPGAVFGMTKKPLVVGDKAITGYSISQAARVYDGQYMDSLFYWMENLGWGTDDPSVPEDRSILLVDTNYTLKPGQIRIEKYLKWGYPKAIAPGGDADWRHFLYNILHQEGFYRGDVNKDGKPTVTDVVYMINYLFKGGPKPIEFEDQGDVNNDGIQTVTDVVYLINFLFKGGHAPIDKNRWFIKSPFVDPDFKPSAVRNPGLFGDPDWVALGN